MTVLANGASGSMATVVCSFLKSNQRAVFVGEETGEPWKVPDYWIEPTIEDLLHGVDTELNFALKLIDQK